MKIQNVDENLDFWSGAIFSANSLWSDKISIQLTYPFWGKVTSTKEQSADNHVTFFYLNDIWKTQKVQLIRSFWAKVETSGKEQKCLRGVLKSLKLTATIQKTWTGITMAFWMLASSPMTKNRRMAWFCRYLTQILTHSATILMSITRTMFLSLNRERHHYTRCEVLCWGVSCLCSVLFWWRLDKAVCRWDNIVSGRPAS